jgi:Lrp/AsnC family transcriptional regulator, leucine-responsive regulatory protein
VKLEPADRRLLKTLQNKGRISNQDLAEATGMSTSACWRRVRALEENGVILRYSAVVDPQALGQEFHAILNVVLTRHLADHQQNFVQAVLAQDEVLDCFATTGDADYHLRVRCRNKDDYNRFLDKVLFRIPGVANVRTSLILKEIKHLTTTPV